MEVKEELRNMAWLEKYRPQHVKDVVCEHTDLILKYMNDPKECPRFLFHSRIGGSGKTSMAKAIVRDLGCDFKYFNASETRGIDDVRDDIKGFILGQSTNGMRRCVILDECEQLTSVASKALKSMIEEYSNNAFFIFTTNDINKIDGPLRNRFMEFEFSNINKDEIKQRLIYICNNENLKYDEKGIDKLISLYYPSIRRMIDILHSLYVKGVSVLENTVVNPDDKFLDLFKVIQSGKYIKIRTIIYEENIDVEYFNKIIFEFLLKGMVTLKQEIKIVQVLSRNVKAFSTGADKQIVFIASLVELIKIFQE